MEQYHGRSLRNPRGGRRRPNRDKRKYEVGGHFSAPKIGSEQIKVISRGRGGSLKTKFKHVAYANVQVEKGRCVRTKILKVISSQDNRNYARQGFITKGAIINTDLGNALVVSRPAQDGVVNARLIKG
ncbi:MAG: 30S ribosomal protein S8e [Candidatus Micrarchaeia archaeon]